RGDKSRSVKSHAKSVVQGLAFVNATLTRVDGGGGWMDQGGVPIKSSSLLIANQPRDRQTYRKTGHIRQRAADVRQSDKQKTPSEKGQQQLWCVCVCIRIGTPSPL
ncbi:unnamed protein product, partial [Ectocarpus sp. 12 AP-2014]